MDDSYTNLEPNKWQSKAEEDSRVKQAGGPHTLTCGWTGPWVSGSRTPYPRVQGLTLRYLLWLPSRVKPWWHSYLNRPALGHETLTVHATQRHAPRVEWIHVFDGALCMKCALWTGNVSITPPVVEALSAHVLAQHPAVRCQPGNCYAHVVIDLEHFALI